ncbi:MAG: twin-arginine translocase subunit TatC [Myxococcales bacterium]|nr:twin-arginine translocase subunit TatC [Myxococcales bacterium]
MSAELVTSDEEEETLDEVDQFRMPLLEHLKELRNRLLWTVGAMSIAFGISLYFATDIIDFLKIPIDRALLDAGVDGGLAIVSGPFEGVYAWLRAAFLGSIVLSSPIIAWQVWGFVAPGLYKTERRIVLPLTVSSTFLFGAGAAFAYYVIFPVAFPFFFTVIDADVNLSVQGYLSAVVKMMLAFGVCFQLPVGSFFLARMGLIDHKDMLSSFRYAVVGIFVIAALITPPDILTQSLLALPLVGLYGIGIVVARVFSTKERDL